MSVVDKMASDNGQMLVNRNSGSFSSLTVRRFNDDDKDEDGDNEDDERAGRGKSERENLIDGEFSNEEEEDEDEKEDDSEVIVPDGGWGWVVCFGSFMVNFILDGTMFSFGILLLDLLDDLGQSKGTTSWAGSALLGFSMTVGPAVSVLLQSYSIRQVTVTGSILALLGFVVSVFSPNVYVLIFTYGIVGGCGFGMIFLPAIIVVGLYFNKKRAIATGIATSGSGLGTFAYAHITDSLLKTYNWRGTVLILAGLVFNCAVCGMLFRPLVDTSLGKKSQKTSRAVDAAEKSKKIRGEDNSSASSGYSSDHVLPDSPQKSSKDEEEGGQAPTRLPGHAPRASSPSHDDPTSKSTSDTLATLSIASSILDDKKQQQLAIPTSTPSPHSRPFCPKCHQKRQSLDDVDITNNLQKTPDGEKSVLVPPRSISQYSISNRRCNCTTTSSKPCKDETCSDTDHSNALPRYKFPKDHTSSSLFHDALVNRLASRDANSHTTQTSTTTSDPRHGEAERVWQAGGQSCDNPSVKITVIAASDNDNTNNKYERSDGNPFDRCCELHDSLQQQQQQQQACEHYPQVHDVAYQMSKENRPLSVLLNSQPVACEYTPGSTSTPFGRPYQSADHLHHLAKGSNPMYYNANELSHLVDTRMLTSEYQLHSRVMGHKRHHVKGHRSTPFHPFSTDPTRASSHHDHISKGLLKPMLRKDIYYSGSVNHLPDFRRCGSVTSFMAAMTRTSSTEKVDVIPEEDEISAKCCPRQVKGLMPWYLFKDSIFILLLVTFTTWTAQSVTLTYLPDLAVSLGIPRSDAAFLISLVGISNILGRVVAGFVTDCLRISSIWLYCVALTLAAGVNVTLALGSSYGLLCICCAIFGLCMGVAVSMRTIVLAEQLGIEVLTQSFGVVALFQGIAFTVNPPIAGKLIDDLHSFKPPFLMAAILYGISGMSCVGVTILGRWRLRKQLQMAYEGEEISLQSQSLNSLSSVEPSRV